MLSKLSISLALHRLLQKLLDNTMVEDQNGDYPGIAVTTSGWDWIDANDGKFTLRRPVKEHLKYDDGVTDDGIPF